MCERIAAQASVAQHCYGALAAMGDAELPARAGAVPVAARSMGRRPVALAPLRARYNEALSALGAQAVGLLRGWSAQLEKITAPTYSYTVRGPRADRRELPPFAQPAADPEDRPAAVRRLG